MEMFHIEHRHYILLASHPADHRSRTRRNRRCVTREYNRWKKHSPESQNSLRKSNLIAAQVSIAPTFFQCRRRQTGAQKNAPHKESQRPAATHHGQLFILFAVTVVSNIHLHFYNENPRLRRLL
jgi:hypothetical protein